MKTSEYLKITAQVSPPEMKDLVIADLAELGFEAFMETDAGFEAGILRESFAEDEVDEVFGHYSAQATLSYTMSELPKENWNQLWEEHCEMVEVSDELLIRAHFHKPEKAFPLELVITPKMSFGTGHHATTRLMALQQLQINHRGKRVFDAGSGTGVLGILAMKLGAASVDACDIDEWSVENARENAAVNQVAMNMQRGKAADFFKADFYDMILANINRNVLVAEMGTYAKMLREGGYLILSGFIVSELDLIANEASEHSLRAYTEKTQDEWVSLCLRKETSS